MEYELVTGMRTGIEQRTSWLNPLNGTHLECLSMISGMEWVVGLIFAI